MLRDIKPAVVIFSLFTILTGVAYPLLLTGIAQMFFPYQANGSLVTAPDGRLVGSSLIGQLFDAPEYFWGRLSATTGEPYNASSSSGSNYSILNDALLEKARAQINELRAADPGNPLPIPVDIVTASGSGLDPHISPAAAYIQVARIARARGLTEAQVRDLIAEHTEAPFLGILGEPRVNVLLLNLALDSVQ